MTVEGIREKLFALQDEKYRDFQQGLIPTVEQKEFIGISWQKSCIRQETWMSSLMICLINTLMRISSTPLPYLRSKILMSA